MLLAPFPAQLGIVQNFPQPAGFGDQFLDALADLGRVGATSLVGFVNMFPQLFQALADRLDKILDRRLARLQVLVGQRLMLLELLGGLLAKLLRARLEHLRSKPLETRVDLRKPVCQRLFALHLGAFVSGDLDSGVREFRRSFVPLATRCVPFLTHRLNALLSFAQRCFQPDDAAAQHGVERNAAHDETGNNSCYEFHLLIGKVYGKYGNYRHCLQGQQGPAHSPPQPVRQP